MKPFASMDAAFYLWSPSFNKEELVDVKTPLSSDMHPRKPEPVRPSKGKKGGGKSASSQQPTKKQPLRGLGVAQLEKLRLEERWKKMTEFHELQPSSDHGAAFQTLPLPFFDPRNPKSFPTSQPFPPSCYTNSSWRSGWSGYSDHRAGGAGSLLPNPSHCPTVVKTEGELSSTQNKTYVSNTWELYLNQKKWQHEDMVELPKGGSSCGGGVDFGRDFAKLSSGGGSGTGDQESFIYGFGGAAHMCAPRFGVHVPGASAASGLNVARRREPIEYEFFPQKFNDGSVRDSTMMHRSTVFEASSSSTASAANFIDLSLKLSCY